MPQESNFNVSPYFDDFDKDKNFYKVLFKPGYPVQARELTTLQSILQNQVEQFGSHFFKEGSKVIPGNWTYNPNFYAVEIGEVFSGVPISLYLDKLVGLKIYGRNSGVRAQILKVLSATESERGNNTLYVYYLDSSSNNFSKREFDDNEVLVCESPIEFGNTFISSDEGFASTIATDSTSVGSAFSLTNGVYFVRGTFVSVVDQTIILDQYTNKPTYRIGLLVNEEVVTYNQDGSLVDNSQGYSNYSAPGADRFKLSAVLFKKDIEDYDDKNFIQLAQIENGILREVSSQNPEYNIFADELARRTFDESGHYYVKPFSTYCRESLNNGRNNGLYKDGQLTTNGNIPAKDLSVYKISPGKAYVKGYEVDVQNPVFLDLKKPRSTKTIESQSVNFQFAPTLSVNNVSGSPLINITSPNIISLRDKRVGSNSGIATGTEIGIARCYDFVLEQGGYDVDNLDRNVWDLSLFDIQTYSTFTLNEPITLSVPTYITGKSTGSTGYLKNSVTNSNTIIVYQISGEFSEKESITFDDPNENKTSRYINDIKNYKLSDVKSVFSSSSGVTFSADTLQVDLGVGKFESATITANGSGISTVTVGGSNLSGLVYGGNLIKYTQPGISTVSYARVENVSYQERYFTISPVESIDQVVYGNLPPSEITVNDLSVLTTKIPSNGNSGNAAGNYSLYSALPKRNISSVDLSSSNLTIRRQYPVSITDGSTGPINVDYENSVFLPFDEERYTLIRSNGTLERLSSDKFDLSSGSTVLTINNLGSNDTGSILIATVRKNKITSKIKKKNIVDSVIIDKSANPSSGSSSSTLNDGLVYGNYPYGTRIQDREICLNYPDIFVIYGIFESNSASPPSSPSLNISSLDGPSNSTSDLIIGESFVGKISGARGFYIERKSDSDIDFIYENQLNFINGEIVTFVDSKANGIVSSVNPGSKNITDNYILNSGQNPIYYDYSRIVRNQNSSEPKGKIKVYFSKGYYDPSDSGDITTANSYTNYIFDQDVSTISNIRLTDLVDFRPRVDDYAVLENTHSPFEFLGRSFSHSKHSSKDVISSDDSLILTYSYYLPRIDRIYLSKDKTFSVKFGIPDDNPSLPDEVSGAMNIANVYLPPYLYRAEDVRVEFVQHKRYQMRDIFKLENRIKNLEEYTTLSLLESDTQNFFVDDGTGTGGNRFKSGFFVDNFSSILTQNVRIGIKNSIDSKKNELRPSHYTTILPLETSTDEVGGDSLDKRYSSIVGSNIKKSNNVITLDYGETIWIRQPFATRTENVTPFFAKTWEGSMQLYPTVDVWIDVDRMESNDVIMEGSFRGVAEALKSEISTQEDGERIGVSPVQWGSWEVTGIDLGTHQEVNSNTNVSQGTAQRAGTQAEFDAIWGPRGATGAPPDTFVFNQATTTTTTTTTTNTFLDLSLSQQRSGEQFTVTEEIDTASFGDRIAKRSIVTFMRTRNIEFTSRGLKPYTQIYSFFDSVDVTDFCCSKLLEIQMVSGTFEVGETVIGQFELEDITNSSNIVSFRVAASNHKYGPYNSPSDTFDRNPYDRQNRLSETYSTSSTVLNIDTFSLSDNASGEFYGIPKKGMVIGGLSSGAQAIISDVRLITDRIGTIIGSFLVPSDAVGSVRFETGRSRFRLTNSPVNSQIEGVVTTFSEETFYSQGDLDTKQETTLSLRNARVSVNDEFRETRSLSDSTLIDSETTVSSSTSARDIGYVDPLAQTFFVDDTTGVYLSKVDVFFATKAESTPVTLQIRETTTGIPNSRILPFSEVELTPDKINISGNASLRTSFVFDTPVYLESRKEYAIVLISTTDEYTVWISTFGQFDVSTLERESGRALVSTQPLLGSFFRSQNASTWEPDSYSDLTFELFRADFASSGFIEVCNSNLPEKMEVMTKNPLTVESNKVKVSLSSTITNANITLGNTIIQNLEGLPQTSGKLIGYGGSASGSLNITSSGVGYVGSNLTYNGVALRSITGEGVNATANITINNGGAISATIVNGGTGYVVGEILEPVSLELGLGMRLSVSEISGRNELIIDNVQGDFNQNIIKFINNSGDPTDFSNDESELTITRISTITDGEHFKVFHRNHGMHSSSNTVILRDIGSNIDKTPLTSQYPSASGSATEISVSDVSEFLTFEGVAVSSGNPGYIKILDEILSYTGTSGNNLTGVSRQIDNTKGFIYSVGTLVEKYEMCGVSLRRINKTHNLSDVSQSIKDPISADYYYIKIDTSQNGINRSVNSGSPRLRFDKTTSAGGSYGKATYNIPFEMLIPNIKQTVPVGTNIKSTVRTISGKSLGGNEVSFLDMGYQDISNNSITYFDTPRIVASKINEENKLFDLPRNKSVSVNIYMSTIDSRISPTLDLSDINLVLISNRINSPINNYANDFRVNTLKEDPNLFAYVSNPILLDNAATSLKVVFDAYVHNDSDIRVLYSIGENSNEFILFPGSSNINPDNQTIISSISSDGSPDSKMVKQDIYTHTPTISNFNQYEFTANVNYDFKYFKIKIIGTSKNQSYIPIIKNLRIIALA